MKKSIFILILIFVLIFCGCSNQSYKENIFSAVQNNQKILTDYVTQVDLNGAITEDLASLGICEVEIDQNNTVIFEMYYTGLFDGGVEYGFYYTESNCKIDKNFSSNDYTLTEAICGNFYYYEWHNG